MANNISLSDILHKRPAVVPTIYGYVLPSVKSHDGYIKIGYTDRADTETRIREQLHTAAIDFKILFKESAMRPDGTCFTDKDVHKLLKTRVLRNLTKALTKTSGLTVLYPMHLLPSRNCARKRGSRAIALGILPCATNSKPPWI